MPGEGREAMAAVGWGGKKRRGRPSAGRRRVRPVGLGPWWCCAAPECAELAGLTALVFVWAADDLERPFAMRIETSSWLPPCRVFRMLAAEIDLTARVASLPTRKPSQ